MWNAWPSIVVEDQSQQLIMYIPAGTTVKYAAGPDGRELRLYTDEWALADRVTHRSLLSFSWPDAEYAVMAFWDPDWHFTGWYVNLERPLGRTATSYDFVDHCLDVLVPPDRSTWTWKDQDELEEAVRRGIFAPEDTERFRAEGERAARRLLAGEPPFDREWAGWRPDPAWPILSLPPGWDVV